VLRLVCSSICFSVSFCCVFLLFCVCVCV
jgi:hypothetical protein